jgi:hypothetical protein
MIMNKKLQKATMMGLAPMIPGAGGLFGLLDAGLLAAGGLGLGAGASGLGAAAALAPRPMDAVNEGRRLLKRPVPIPSGPMPPWAPAVPWDSMSPIPTPAVPSMPNTPIPWGLPMPPHMMPGLPNIPFNQIQPMPTPKAIPDMPDILPPWGRPMEPGGKGRSALMDYLNAISKDRQY